MNNDKQHEVARAIAQANGDDYDELTPDEDGYVWTTRRSSTEQPTQQRYDAMAAAALEVMPDQSPKQLRLGELIAKLGDMPKDAEVRFDFASFTPTILDSYRGYYDQLALGFESWNRVTVKEFLGRCQSALGRRYTGYKGGSYLMNERTPVWVANYGETSDTVIVDVQEHDRIVVLVTAHQGWSEVY